MRAVASFFIIPQEETLSESAISVFDLFSVFKGSLIAPDKRDIG